MLGGRGTLRGYFTMGSLCDVLLLPGLIPVVGPFLGGLGAVYWLYVCWFGIREVYGLSGARALAVHMACIGVAMICGVVVLAVGPVWLTALLL